MVSSVNRADDHRCIVDAMSGTGGFEKFTGRESEPVRCLRHSPGLQFTGNRFASKSEGVLERLSAFSDTQRCV